MVEKKKFAGARSLRSRKEESAKVEETQKRGGGGKSGYHRIKSGKNIFRVAPPHDPEEGALEPRQVSWLYFEGEDGKEIRKPIFNAKLHGDQEKDLVEEYLDFLYDIVSQEHSDHKDRSNVMAPAFGFQGASGKFVRGIRPSTDWMCYAWDDANALGSLSMYPDMVDRMEELAIDEESDQEITVDPFSDPETGVNLIIIYDPDGGKGKKYKVNKGSKPRPLSEEQEEELAEQTPLSERFRNVYTTHDFDMALDGLETFDTKFKFGIFDFSEWSEICKGLRALLPDPVEKDDKEAEEEPPKRTERTARPTTRKPAAKKEEDEVAINPEIIEKIDTEWGVNEMDENALIAFIEDMDLSVVLLRSDNEESIRAKVYVVAADLLGGSVDKDAENPFIEETPKKTTPPVRTRARPTSGGKTLSEVRKSLKK